MDELDEETDESHNSKSNSCGHCNLLELFPVWFCASFDKTDGVFGKLLAWFNILHHLRSESVV